jgi:hypothetical protein
MLARTHRKGGNRTENIARKNPDAGDVWLWVAVDADSVSAFVEARQRDLATGEHAPV